MKLTFIVAVAAFMAEVCEAQLKTILSDFPVSEVTNARVYKPVIAPNGLNGSFAVSWGDSRLGTSNRSAGEGDIYGAIIGADAKAITKNFKVDKISFSTSYADFWLDYSYPLFLPNGTLVVAWHVEGTSVVYGIKSYDVYYSAFDAQGRSLGADVQINRSNTTTPGSGYRPSSVLIPPSTLLFVFEYSKDGENIGGTTVNLSNGSIGNTFLISDNALENRILSFAASNGNHTIVVWTDGRSDPSKGDIYMQRFVGANPSGGNVRVNADAAGGYNQFGKVAMAPDGRFVIVWIDTRSNPGGDLYAQLFGSDGSRTGNEIKLTGSNSYFFTYPPGVAMDNSGNFVVAWTDSVPGHLFTAKTRAFSSSGSPLTGILEVTNSFTTARSGQVDVKAGSDGSLYYTWLDARLDPANGRIFAKVSSSIATGIKEESVPEKFYLNQNYPNPFNPTTAIGYQLSAVSHVTLKVYDMLGREVATLVDGQQNPGVYKVTFDGGKYSSGVYFYRIVATGNNGQRFSAIKKLVLMK
ncbi:MAG: T9SS type A sorting domain-containing protein [Bacteroidetes bacterium]|nr:T9SS type A sorting domain-containing protein [Bacteroidota bacterium]MCL5737966.1 T9SS type A sorting domain-containing protein [Bacteroidota bacterium]